MTVGSKKNNTNSLLKEELAGDKTVSDAINDAFDNAELSTVGKLCLDARVNKGLTQEQAGSLLKVRVKIIKDFENGDQIDLPGLAYKVGFVRSYARLLDLDSDLLVQEFKESLELNTFKEEYKFLTPEINKNNFLPIGAIVSVFIAILSYTGWYYSDRSNNIVQISDDKTEDKVYKKAEIENNSYVIIEENLNSPSTSNINIVEQQVQDTNVKTKLNNKIESKVYQTTEITNSEIVNQNNVIDPTLNENQTSEMSAVTKEIQGQRWFKSHRE